MWKKEMRQKKRVGGMRFGGGMVGEAAGSEKLEERIESKRN